MKKKVLNVLLFATLSLVAASCQKETSDNPNYPAAEISTAYSVTYTIDGVSQMDIVSSYLLYTQLVNRLLESATAGHSVTFKIAERSSNVANSKDVKKYSTKDRDQAFKWCETMGQQGYAVSVSFDKETGTYNCVAFN